MRSSAKEFVRSRHTPVAITISRVCDIYEYIFKCYSILIRDQITYSRIWVKANTKDSFENFLKKRLVHDYLKKYKHQELMSSVLEDILFECEPEMPYTYFDPNAQLKIEANDRIDIKVNRIGLQEIWKTEDNHDIYLAIECKVLRKFSDNAQYLNDIRKFCGRDYVHLRLPVEGMLAFCESNKPTISEFVVDLNEKINACNDIVTLQLLDRYKKIDDLKTFYLSQHSRNVGTKQEFTICHLYLNYTMIIAN